MLLLFPTFCYFHNSTGISPEGPISKTVLWLPFPASRGLFFFAFAGLTSMGKRDLCLGSKFTVLSVRGGNLATVRLT